MLQVKLREKNDIQLKIDDLEKQNQTLSSQLEKSLENLEVMKDKVANFQGNEEPDPTPKQKPPELIKAERTVLQIKSEMKKKEEELEQYTSKNSQFDIQESDIKDLNEETARLEKEIASFVEEDKELESNVLSLQKKLFQAQKEKSTIQNHIAELIQLKNSLTVNVPLLEEEIQGLKLSIQLYESGELAQHIQDEIDKITAEHIPILDELNEKINELESNRDYNESLEYDVSEGLFNIFAKKKFDIQQFCTLWEFGKEETQTIYGITKRPPSTWNSTFAGFDATLYFMEIRFQSSQFKMTAISVFSDSCLGFEIFGGSQNNWESLTYQFSEDEELKSNGILDVNNEEYYPSYRISQVLNSSTDIPVFSINYLELFGSIKFE